MITGMFISFIMIAMGFAFLVIALTIKDSVSTADKAFKSFENEYQDYLVRQARYEGFLQGIESVEKNRKSIKVIA